MAEQEQHLKRDDSEPSEERRVGSEINADTLIILLDLMYPDRKHSPH